MTESEFQETIIGNLERIREEMGLTITEFSELCAVSPRGYYWWLKGTMPGAYHLYRLRLAMGGERWEVILS